MPSKIEWTNETWNPIVGCSKVSSGCDNCYAERMARRLAHMGKEGYGYVTHKKGGWNGKIYRKFYNDVINKPLHWKKPRMVFVSSMGDLFHENVPFEWIDKVVEVAEVTPWHTYQFLTKRADRMLEYFKWRWNNADQHTLDCTKAKQWKKEHDIDDVSMYVPNLWLGVTCENQECADMRLPQLLQTPAAVRFVSVEPCLESVNIEYWLHRINWVIVGCESGPKRRECKIEWVRSIIRQCKPAGIPVFVKQLSINGKISHDIKEWPKDLQVREWPKDGK